MDARIDSTTGNFTFGGWSKMALPIVSMRITHVGPPSIGEEIPSSVKAEVRFRTTMVAYLFISNF